METEIYKGENALTESQPPKPADPFENQPVVVDGTTQLLKVSFRLMSILCYLPFLSVASAVAAITTEPISNKFVRFHAWQSLFFMGAWFVACIGLMVLAMLNPILGAMGNLIVTGGYIYKSVMMMIEANKGKMTRLPVIGDWADGML